MKKLRGERAPLAKFTSDQVRKVRERRSAGEKLAPLAREFGVTESVISEIASRKTYRDVS